jgi:electron transport complex protein RnfD
MRKRRHTLGDLSAVVTGVILALSLPGTAPWYIGCIGGFAAIGFGKVVFGGLGQNIFNPAMVGRAFVMIAFAGVMGATAYQDANSTVIAVTQATPMQAFKQEGVVTPLWQLFFGNTNGSLGETSALACLLGGIYLCLRRTASWEIPLGVLLSVGVFGGIWNLTHVESQFTLLHQLLGGALLFGAFFIATDPVTSPLTPKGKFIFGVGIGAFVMLMRVFSSYPEGVMFAVLIMNSVVPLINRWTVPRPVGGPVPAVQE